MKRNAIAMGVSLLFLAACSSNPAPAAPAAPAPVNPAGYFEFSTELEGQWVTGGIEIRTVDGGGHTGVLTTSATEPVPVRSVVVEGQKMTVTCDTPDGPVVMILTFTGDAFTGPWTYAGMGGTATGKRIR